MDSSSERQSQKPILHNQNLIYSQGQDSINYQPILLSTNQKLMNESQVQGPQFSQQKFKKEIDQVSAKMVDDDIQRSPLQDIQTAFKYNKIRTVSSKKLVSNIQLESDQKLDDQQKLNQYSGVFPTNVRIESIKHLDDDSEQQSFQEMNQSFDLTDNNAKKRNFSTSTRNRSQKQTQILQGQQSQDEIQQSNNINLGILSLGQNGHKKRGSAIFINPPGGISMQSSLVDQRKHSIFSAYQSNLNIDIRFNETLSPSKIQMNDLLSKGGLISEPCSPSITKKSRNNDPNQQPQGQQNLLHLKNVSGYITADITLAEKSIGDLSIKQTEGFKGIWKKSAFTILTLTKKFINNIKELSMSYKFSQMKRHYFELIGDKSNDYNFFHVNQKLVNDSPSHLRMFVYKMRGTFNKYLYINKIGQNNKAKVFLNNFFNINIGIVLPDDFIKVVWDTFILFLLLINLLYIPMKISFSEVTGFNEYLLVFFDDLPSWAFICDVILNFNTAYYCKGVINKERLKIFKHYVKGQFFWDILVVIPFFFSSVLNVKFLNIILLLRTSKVLKIVTSIEELLNLQQFQTCVLSLVKLCITIIYIAHICGCFFYYMHVLQVQQDSNSFTWVVKFGLENTGWLSLYISSVYWAVITMITLGYGDIYPVTNLEKTFVIIVTLLSCGVFAYAVNAIGYIIQDMTKKSTEFKVKMSSLLSHMKKRELSNVTQMRVKKYFQYLHDESHDDNEDGQKLINQCNSSLKNEVLTEMYSKVLQSRKEFRLNFSKEFLQKLALKMRERRLGPEEIIFRENEFCKRVYFVMRGNVALQRTRSTNTQDQEKQKDINMKILKKGDLFGLESFLTGSETNVKAKTENVVSLIYLHYDDFFQVIQDFKIDKERYFMIKDKLNLQKACRGSGICCSLCDSFYHQFLNCPYMSYQPNHRKVILNYLKEQVQKRNEYERKVMRTSSTLFETFKVQEDAIRILFEFNPFETINQLLENIYKLEDEGSLQIDTHNIITKYLKDPQEFDDIDDIPEDEEIDQYIKASNNDQVSNNNQVHEHFDDSVRIRRATVGSLMSKPEKQTEVYNNNGGFSNTFIRYGSLKVNINGAQQEVQLEVPKRNEERKSSLRKQTQFSNYGQVIYIKNDDKSPSRRFRQTNSIESSSMKQINSENVINTPQLTHNLPGSPQLEKNREKQSKYHKSYKSLKDDEESIERHTPYLNNMGASQISYHQLDNFRTVSIKSSKSQKARAQDIESKKENDINQPTANHHLNQNSSMQAIKDFMTLPNFESVFTWEVYFPNNNVEKVLSSYDKMLEKILKEKRKRRRRTNRTHSQKHKQMQQIYSKIESRNQQKNFSKGFSRHQKSKQSFISHKDSSLMPIQNPSQVLGVSPRNDGREPSRSQVSALDFQIDVTNQNVNASVYN